MNIKQIAAGIIIYDGKVLLGQRKKGKDLEFKWELPGGKLEEGETLPECLCRELIEELNRQIVVKDFFMKTDYTYNFGHIVLNTFIAECTDPSITKTEAPQISHQCVVFKKHADRAKYLDYLLHKPDFFGLVFLRTVVAAYIKSLQ